MGEKMGTNEGTSENNPDKHPLDFECPVCKEKFKGEYERDGHCLSFHERFDWYGCLSYAFPLYQWMCRHEGKVFCRVCLKDFKDETICSKHIAKAHPGFSSKGDGTEDQVESKREEPARERPKETAVHDDPIKILAIRFAKGEITEKELDRKIAHLKKHGLVK